MRDGFFRHSIGKSSPVRGSSRAKDHGRVKHLIFANKSLLLDDDSADLLAEYAAALGDNDSADSVEVRALGPDGNEVDVTFVLNSRSELVVESTNTSVEPPRNSAAVEYMRSALERLVSPNEVKPYADVDSREERRFVEDH